MNLKAFAQRRTISKVKRQPSEWEKIIANEAIDKELISNYMSNSCSSIPEKKKKKKAKELNRHFSKRRHTDG